MGMGRAWSGAGKLGLRLGQVSVVKTTTECTASKNDKKRKEHMKKSSSCSGYFWLRQYSEWTLKNQYNELL